MAKHLGLTDVSHTALIRAAREVVAGALAGDFPQDPVIGPDLSRAISTLGSVVKRHGGLIELGIAGALIASERFVVLTNVCAPCHQRSSAVARREKLRPGLGQDQALG